jgi:hypothetical protein
MYSRARYDVTAMLLILSLVLTGLARGGGKYNFKKLMNLFCLEEC